MSTFAEFLEDIQLAYAYTIDKITSEWVKDEDGAINYYQCVKKKVIKINKNIDFIYQPMKDDLDEVSSHAAVIIKASKGSGYIITKEIFDQAKHLLNQVDIKFIESVNSFITNFGIWIKPVNYKSTFNQLLNITKPVHFDKDCIKIKFEIGYYYDGPMTRWSGPELKNWIYILPAHEKMRKAEFESQKEEYQNTLLKIEEKISDLELRSKELEIAFNQLHAQEINDKLETAYKVKEEFSEYIKHLEELISKPQVFGAKDTNYSRGEFDTKEFMEKSEEERKLIHSEYKSSTISFRDAFPGKVFLKIKIPRSNIESESTPESISDSAFVVQKRSKKNETE